MPRGAPLLSATVDIATATTHDVIAAVAGQKVYVFGMWLWSSGIVTLTIQDAATGNFAGPMDLVAQSSVEFDLRDEPWFVTTAGNAFRLTLGGAFQVSGRIYYTQGP